MPEFIAFEATDPVRLARLIALVRAIQEAKQTDDFRDDSYWESMLDEQAREIFWWPTEAEAAEWQRRWSATPVPERWHRKDLETPWVFGSLIDAAQNGEYSALNCEQRPDGMAVLEFEPEAWPFGGTAWMRALVEAFGGRVLEDTAAGR